MEKDDDFNSYRSIIILVNTQKDVVIFPQSKTEDPVELADGSIIEFSYQVAYCPIELKYPYSSAELAEKIKFGIEQWNKYKCYTEEYGTGVTFEEKYYGVKGFKKAVRGILYIHLGWDDIQGKYVSLSMPLKRGYAYIELDNTELPENAEWIDFANAVISYIEADLTIFRSFKTYKKSLNI